MRRPLNGIRVLDFCWIGAGSYTTKILADMGADVIKVESEMHLDSLRKGPPFKDGKPGVNRSGYFADRNSSKRSLTLNMKHPEAREVALDLVRSCDLVTNNFTPGVMERFGLGYDSVRAVKPDIIFVSMSMQGQTGPESAYLGYGLTIGAVTGLQYLSGLPDREPSGTGTNYPDHIPNPCHTAFAIIAALRHRRRTGEGQVIDVAQTEPTVAILGSEMCAAWSGGPEQARQGNRAQGMAPHGVFPVQGEDRWIAIAAPDNAAWAGIERVLGSFGPGLDTLAGRLAAVDRLEAMIAERTLGWEGQALMSALQAEAVAAGIVQTAADIVDTDPQLRHRNHWQVMAQPGVGDMLYNAPPWRFSVTPSGLRGPAPLLGEHTQAIVEEELGRVGAGAAAPDLFR
ncbi:MAG: CaiB/BaiF CoA transferase family protein [Pararhodobacter sp.]